MPFLRLTRDRRGFENTFLMHADRPGDRPRVLYWYRTAPGILLGRPALDEDAIRTIEEQHPDIEFDWPAILALSEVMIHEEEAPPQRQQPQPREGRRRRGERRQPASAREQSGERRRDVNEPAGPVASADADDDFESGTESFEPGESLALGTKLSEPVEPLEPLEPVHHVAGLLEELAGREIATRLRGRYAEIMARIHEQDADAALRDVWVKRAEPLNPDLWLTPQAILEGVRHADTLFEQLRRELRAAS
ncbi:MAG TPA: hypothetical protein VFP85_13600 [Vicinamibacterales bacterium]|nr:hypothetical protein [Vicinamibacterales bacterium]